MNNINMTTEALDGKSLLAEIDKAVSGLQGQMASLDEGLVNTIPYKDNWTAGQLFRHVIKSTTGIDQVLKSKAAVAKRPPDARVKELKDTFFDFSIKMQSPQEIVPEPGPYEKEALMQDMKTAFDSLRKPAETANLNEIVEGLPLGPITKLEMLHFVLYHTQRHLQQMQRICAAVQKTK